MKKGDTIIITHIPISAPRDEVFASSICERTLVNAICKYSGHLRKNDVEVFERKGNIIATEEGYYFALYEKDVREMEGGIDNPKPFKGKDGRLKVEVIKENGEKAIEDLATLIAMSYSPNPNKYTKVFFRDNNPENCIANNLYWVSKLKYFFLSTFITKR